MSEHDMGTLGRLSLLEETNHTVGTENQPNVVVDGTLEIEDHTTDAVLASMHSTTGSDPQTSEALANVVMDSMSSMLGLVMTPPSNWPFPTSSNFNTLAPRPMDGNSSTGGADASSGSAGALLTRLGEASFEDDGETLAGEDRPNPRDISNIVMDQDGDMPNAAGASDFLWAWGQFVDHDIGLTEAGHTESADIPVPTGDPLFDPFGTGTATIHFNRVDDADPDTAGRQYENALTAFIDGSQIYGSSDAEAAALRVDGGKMIMTASGYLVDDDGSLATGDIRAAENIVLTSMHTLFAREHNRIASEIAEERPYLDEDAIFNEARARVEAQMQAITFNEFLPMLVGDDAFDAYDGYDASVDPGLSVEFTTAIFRFGHTMLSSELLRTEEDGDEIAGGHIALRDAFFSPHEIYDNGGIDPILRGTAEGTAQEIDANIVDDVRSFLFGPPGAGGFDLAALNIQRGRDLGIPTYNGLREALGLEVATTFADISSDPAVAAALEAAYGDIALVDAWVGGLAEDTYGDGMLGETFSIAMIDQFSRLRDGDPFWSEGRGFSDKELAELWDTKLSDVIERNTDIDHIQEDVFIAHDRMGGTDADDVMEGSDGHDLMIGFGGDDVMRGGEGDDDLFGDAGTDTLIGDLGNDIMTGGAGNDTFVFDASIAGHDTITDFDSGDALMVKNFYKGDFRMELEDGGFVVTLSDVATITFEGQDAMGWVIGELFF